MKVVLLIVIAVQAVCLFISLKQEREMQQSLLTLMNTCQRLEDAEQQLMTEDDFLKKVCFRNLTKPQ